MKVTVLGCGSSGGVPLVGGNWGVCDPKNPRNRRTRVSILVENAETTLLVDTSPDVRQQLLDCDLKRLDAVLYTHAHADHCHGIDELRSINWLTAKPVELYADPVTLAELKERFAYVFRCSSNKSNFYKPAVHARELHGPFSVNTLNVIPFDQIHGDVVSVGYRFGDFTYSTDVHEFSEASWQALKGTKIWLVDCVRMEPHPTHSHLDQTLEWIERLKPERAYLTHMNHLLDYDALVKLLPSHIEPAYDGLVIEC
jgi:phosphoribosyl 1,2-cyclic phosphate phosphodiesterase